MISFAHFLLQYASHVVVSGKCP